MISIILFIGLASLISAQDFCACPAIYQPVCCNGQEYSNDCVARCNNCADADITDGPCPSDPGDVCANTVCNDENEEWCIEDPIAGAQCTSCAAFTCLSGQDCVVGVGCQPVITCANVLCAQGSYCIYDDTNGPRCVDPCECNTDDDCDPGFVCNETPVGFEGCSDKTDSCFGFCSRIEGGCLGFTGAPCDGAEICINVGGTQGTCYAPQETCEPDITCANVDCLPGATCIEDPVEGPICVPIYSCGGIDYCTSYIENNCNTCICDANGLEACTEIACNPPQVTDPVCDTCVDGFTLSDDGSSCDFNGDCPCTREFEPVCCNGYTYSNACTAGCAGCSDEQIQDGGCNTEPETTEGDGLKECTKNGPNGECSSGYKCRPNPNCGGNSGSCSPQKVCVDIAQGFCSDDSECDTANGYSCINGNRPNGKGYGNGNGNGNGNCIKFEEP